MGVSLLFPCQLLMSNILVYEPQSSLVKYFVIQIVSYIVLSFYM